MSENNLEKENKVKTPRAKKTIIMERFGIFLSSLIFFVMIFAGIYGLVEKDAYIDNISNYIGGVLFLAAFFIPSIILRYAYRFEPFRVRNVFFSQLSLLLGLILFVALALIPGSFGLIVYTWWFPTILIIIGGFLYFLAWKIRDRPRYIIGGFMIGVASILLFFGLLSLFLVKFTI
ncbi:MAG: hypothetical protein ACTSVI_01780 [Promethearchaeota archaeon]